MKHLPMRLIALLICVALLLPGCAYHGKIHRGIYNHRDFEEKTHARVMVVSDKYYQPWVSADYTGKYTYRLTDGLPVAVADALGTLFTEVDVNEYRFRQHYDYIVEIDYKIDLHIGPSKFITPNVLLPKYETGPVLITYLTLTFRNPKTGYAVARYAHKSYELVSTTRNDWGLWLGSVATVLTLGLFSPVQTQLIGAKLRRDMENGIEKVLYRYIIPELFEDRLNYTKDHLTEETNTRVDGKFLPFMQATAYITNDDGSGSGFFISPDGYLITNAHVVGKNRDVGIILYDNRNVMDKTNPTAWPDKDTIRNKVIFGRVLKVNKKRDLALVKVEGENFPWLELETNRQAYVTGHKVAAIGAPRNIEWSVSEGIISAARDKNGVDTIQTDTAINGGNSGGPLIDLETGKVIGVNSWSRVPEKDLEDLQKGVENLNFAISAFEVQRTLGVTQPIDPDDFPRPTDDIKPALSQQIQNYVKY